MACEDSNTCDKYTCEHFLLYVRSLDLVSVHLHVDQTEECHASSLSAILALRILQDSCCKALPDNTEYEDSLSHLEFQNREAFLGRKTGIAEP